MRLESLQCMSKLSNILRPEQHGSDMLGPISDLLEKCPEEKDAVIANLALEGLYYLCEAEVGKY